MAKNRHSYSLKSNNKCSSPSERRFSERLSQGYRVTRRDLHFESLEERMLLSINTGDPTEHDFHGSVLTAWLPDGTTREDLENQLRSKV